jgi:hypothetical protein
LRILSRIYPYYLIKSELKNMLKRSNWAYLNGFSTTSPRKVSSSTFKRGFSTTSPRKMLDVGTIANPEVIVNTPLVIAAAITG